MSAHRRMQREQQRNTGKRVKDELLRVAREEPENVIWGADGEGLLGIMLQRFEHHEKYEFGVGIVDRHGQATSFVGLTRADMARLSARSAELGRVIDMPPEAKADD